jgi:hypothetical protein
MLRRWVLIATVSLWSYPLFGGEAGLREGMRSDESVWPTLIGIEPCSDEFIEAASPSRCDYAVQAYPSACDACSVPPRNGFWGEVSGVVWLGGLSGHLHTPTGGQPGTTSPNRPTVGEIGLDGLDAMPCLDARFGFTPRHELHLTYVAIERSGTDVLGTTLISQGRTFPAGSAVRSEFGLDTVRIGYRPHAWQCCTDQWRLTPEFGVGMALFEYQLNSPSASGPVDRSYNVGFPYLGLLYERPLSDRLQFETDLAGFGGVNGVSFVDCEFRLAYNVACSGRWNSSLLLGWRGVWFRRHDAQRGEQNDPNLRLGWLAEDPWSGLTLGLRLGF